jgi:hypothetical protein
MGSTHTSDDVECVLDGVGYVLDDNEKGDLTINLEASGDPTQAMCLTTLM